MVSTLSVEAITRMGEDGEERVPKSSLFAAGGGGGASVGNVEVERLASRMANWRGEPFVALWQPPDAVQAKGLGGRPRSDRIGRRLRATDT
jgi:hypothetical protein